VISFLRAATLHPEEVAAMQPDAISFDWQRPLASMRSKLGSRITLQGNLDPDLLFASLPVIEDESVKLLDSMKDDPAFIFNLGHGIKPHTPWHAVRHLVDVVHR
jgi:uroporphyrinogen decarboxylase